MFLSRLHRRITTWVALLTLVLGALAPTVAQALVAGGDRSDWMLVCSVRRVSGSSSRPSKWAASQSGTAAPHAEEGGQHRGQGAQRPHDRPGTSNTV